MTGAFRVPRRGIDGSRREVRFSFNGRLFTGLAGDTLASALLANGVHLMGRSFKYHRARGVLTAGSAEPNALVSIDRGAGRVTPNVRATMQEIYDGLRATSQNHFPSLHFDLGSAADLLSPLIPAGFYYKTFMWPRMAWRMLYEPAIRRMAGLGVAPTAADPDRYAMRHAHCDVLVVGGGPAGLAAALAAAESGESVILCDENARLGGAILAEPATSSMGAAMAGWLERTLTDLVSRRNVRLLTRTTAFGIYGQNAVALAERRTDHLPPEAAHGSRERLWQIRARRIVIAAGAQEQPLVFPGNDRPGVMLAGAARTYLNQFDVLPGRRPLVVTADDSAYALAKELIAAGARPAAVVDLRPDACPMLAKDISACGVAVFTGGMVLGVKGAHRVRGARVADANGRVRKVNCDAIFMSGGWAPSLSLVSQASGQIVWSEEANTYLPGALPKDIRCAGACAAAGSLQDAIDQGTSAGFWAGRVRRAEPPSQTAPEARLSPASGGPLVSPVTRQVSGLRGKAFIDFQNDVTAKDVQLAIREGFHSIEHIKRYTTTGMATDQGRTSNLNALSIASDTLGLPVPQVGLTTFRPPYTPVTFGVLANFARDGDLDPVRKAPMHDWAVGQGAVFEDVGMWRRARYFPRAGESMRTAVARECLATRRSAGVYDASTLGKIEVVGPDAAEFLNRMYTGSWSKLAVGRCKYGVMLREDGFIFDDGVIGRMAADRFHVTTTTSGAARVLAHMEDYLQTEFPDLRVWLTSTTEQWAVIAVNGPKSRDIVGAVVDGLDLSNEAFPHMSVAEARMLDTPIRLFRVSFTGELGFEVNVPSALATVAWQAVMEAGAAHDLCPYGTETMHVLRAEKGYIIIGQDTDGTVTPEDAGLGWAVGKTKPDFVGLRSLQRPDIVDSHRKQLVGLLPTDPNLVLEEGAQLVEEEMIGEPGSSLGHVTSSYWSGLLGRSFALGLVESGRQRKGQVLLATTSRGFAPVRIEAPSFYDQGGERLNG
ncbi:MAG: sarcosine oxidase subunit alpha family protein [Caulobacter sp.]|nr:sarcosine oxidase subunit alpha family protein [Caulobacter sp.]